MEQNLSYICGKKGKKTMIEIIIIAVFAIITAREMRKERENPGCRSQTDSDINRSRRGQNGLWWW